MFMVDKNVNIFYHLFYQTKLPIWIKYTLIKVLFLLFEFKLNYFLIKLK